MFVNKKEIIKFKAENKNVDFPTQFCLGRISNGFTATESREYLQKGMWMIFHSFRNLLINLTY